LYENPIIIHNRLACLRDHCTCLVDAKFKYQSHKSLNHCDIAHKVYTGIKKNFGNYFRGGCLTRRWY